ncbi:MAG: COG4223 family protein [Geminicoccaceae bacterium]
MPGLLGGIVGGAATALAMSLFLVGGDGDDVTTALENRLAAAEEQVGQVGALDQRLATIEAAPTAGAAAGSDEMAQRIGDLEAKLAALGEAAGDDDALGEQLTALGERIEALVGEVQNASETGQTNAQALDELSSSLPTLEETLAATGKAVEQTGVQTTAINQSVETLSGDVQTLATRVGKAEGRLDHLGGEYQRGAGMIVAIGDINRAITRSEPYDSALQSLKSLVRDDAVLGETVATLEPMATDGVAAVAELKREFADMASRVLLAEEGDQSLTDQVSDNVFGIFNMRPAGGNTEGSGSRAVLSRAQGSLSNNDLDGAVAELGGLEGAAAEAAGPWLERANGRLSAEAAVVDLRSHAQGLVAKGS